MGVSQKYRTFSQLMEDVSIDFSTYALDANGFPIFKLCI